MTEHPAVNILEEHNGDTIGDEARFGSKLFARIGDLTHPDFLTAIIRLNKYTGFELQLIGNLFLQDRMAVTVSSKGIYFLIRGTLSHMPWWYSLQAIATTFSELCHFVEFEIDDRITDSLVRKGVAGRIWYLRIHEEGNELIEEEKIPLNHTII